MRKLLVIAIAAVALAGCHRGAQAKTAPRPLFNAAQFVVMTSERARSDAQFSQIATSKGYLRDVRDFGRESIPDERSISDAAAALARRRGITIPPLEDKRIALLQNLEIVRGPNFDQAYVMAMVQDLDAMVQELALAGKSNDAEVRDFATRFAPVASERRSKAYAVLKEIGGSPFVVAP